MNRRKSRNSDLARLTAEICGVSEDYVRKVIKGYRRNERVLRVYFMIRLGKEKLLAEVKKNSDDK
ncbi:MAG: hypothetical protein IRZ03_14480 [Acidobacterium ailaaui]|nr:hypothetical protein [Pseudacidobacterium ailaaui]